MTAKHTPGPWEAVQPRHRDHSGAAIEIRPEGKRPAREWAHVASIYCASPHADADARLIAAAPDLYEALVDALREADDCRPSKSPKAGIIPRPHFMWRERARAALAKVAGRSNG